jgi:glycosyltransferase involved in cell wall biosynthesis
VRNIQILEVVSGFGVGGAEKALAARMGYLPEGFEQSVLNIRPEIDSFEPPVEFKEIKVFKRNFRNMLVIQRFVRDQRFDLVIVRTPLDAIRFSLLKNFSYEHRFKLVFEAHSNFITKKVGFRFFLGRLLKWSARNIDLVIAVSDDVSQGPLCSGQKNVQTVYLGSKIDFLDHIDSLEQTPHLLFVGRLVEIKRPVWLLERILNLAHKIELPKPTLTVVGSGPLQASVNDFVHTNNLEEVVRCVGLVDNVSEYYASSTHLVSCSTNEGLPLTFFEAKLAGLSILATPSGGGAEIFGKEDVLLKSFGEDEFESALLRILSSPAPSLDIRREIQSKSQWMSAEQCAEHYYALLTQLFSK